MTNWIPSTVVVPYFCGLFVVYALGLGCYQCQSFNGSDPDCHDPFNSTTVTRKKYVRHCKAGKQNYAGLFPAHYCFKIKGKSGDLEIFIRDCTHQDMGNMCGLFKYENQQMKGCIKTCRKDGCNTASRQRGAGSKPLIFTLATLLVFVVGTRTL